MSIFDNDIKLPAAPVVSDPQTYRELLVVYNSMRAMFDAMERKHKLPVIFSEFADIGYIMSFFDVSGVMQVRKALHATYEAHCVVTIGANAGEVGEVQLFGIVRIDNGYTAGTKLWLANSPAGGVDVSPGAGGQRIGYILNTTYVWFDPEMLP